MAVRTKGSNYCSPFSFILAPIHELALKYKLGGRSGKMNRLKGGVLQSLFIVIAGAPLLSDSFNKGLASLPLAFYQSSDISLV